MSEPQMRADCPKAQGKFPSLIWDLSFSLSGWLWQLLYPADSLCSEDDQNPQPFFSGTA